MRRLLVPIALVASIAVGLAGGIELARQSPQLFLSKPAPSSKPRHTVDPFAFPPMPPKTIAALHALGTTQTPSDAFPVPSFISATHVDPTTTHRILTTSDGSVLWIGRTSQRLCLMFSSSDPFPTNGIVAGSSCANPTQFADSGLVLQEGNDTWTWNGVRFTTTIGP